MSVNLLSPHKQAVTQSSVRADCYVRLLFAGLLRKYDLSVISACPRYVAPRIGGAQVPFRCSLQMRAGETARSLAADNLQSCVTGYSVASISVDEKQRAGRTSVERTGKERSAVDVYGTVAMNYVPAQRLHPVW